MCSVRWCCQTVRWLWRSATRSTVLWRTLRRGPGGFHQRAGHKMRIKTLGRRRWLCGRAPRLLPPFCGYVCFYVPPAFLPSILSPCCHAHPRIKLQYHRCDLCDRISPARPVEKKRHAPCSVPEHRDTAHRTEIPNRHVHRPLAACTPPIAARHAPCVRSAPPQRHHTTDVLALPAGAIHRLLHDGPRSLHGVNLFAIWPTLPSWCQPFRHLGHGT